MPRNGSGIYSKPAGTTAVADTLIESAKYNQTIDDLVADANDPRPITAGGTGAPSAGAARTSLGVDAARTFATKSANYTALAADKNVHLRFDGSYTLSLTAAATLTSGWYCFVQADGGAVTIDPNGAETINGQSTIIIPNGGSSVIWCTGSTFYATKTATPSGDFRNKVINGTFQEWNYSTSQTSSGFGSADRWNNAHSGSTKTVARAGISPGLFPFPDKFSIQTTVSSVAGASNFVRQIQTVEDVRTLQGKTATLTFYARTTGADKQIAVEFFQNFGTGGSPSAAITGIGVTKVTLSSTLGVAGFQRYDVVVSIPSVSGKTIGTDENSYLGFSFWFDAGTSFNSRTGSLGQQSGVFEIMHVSLVEGDATGDPDPMGDRSPEAEASLCERFYQTGNVRMTAYQAAANGFGYNATLRTKMRATPTIAFSGTSYTNASGLAASSVTDNGFLALSVATALGTCAFVSSYSASAELT